MSKKPEPSAPDFTGDEHWGRGGQYVVVDGKRVPAPEPAPEAATSPAAPTEPSAKKGN